MSKSLLFHFFREIESCAAAVELLPVSQDIQSRQDLTPAERASLLAKVNERLATFGNKGPRPVASGRQKQKSIKQLFCKHSTNVEQTDPDFYPQWTGGKL